MALPTLILAPPTVLQDLFQSPFDLLRPLDPALHLLYLTHPSGVLPYPIDTASPAHPSAEPIHKGCSGPIFFPKPSHLDGPFSNESYPTQGHS